jgi:uncharacterized protein YydD (DUF2326 family)
MIRSITSPTISTFKRVEFQAGLNVLVADKTAASTQKQTRNSAGKTSLIEIIHFLFGSDCDKDSLFRTSALLAHCFEGTFVFPEGTFTVQRGGEEPSRIFLIQWPDSTKVEVKEDKATGRMYIPNTAWKAYLGSEQFALPLERSGSPFDSPGSPSYRSLFSYFVRRWNAGGFQHTERFAEQQQRSDWQVNLSYLLGLDWEIAQSFQKVRDRERNLKELKKAAKAGALGSVIGTVAELRPKVALAEKRGSTLRQQLARFQVLDSYADQAGRAAGAKSQMQQLTRETINIQELIQHLSMSLESERPTSAPGLQQLYAAAKIELPGVVLKRLDDVQKFHESVVENRITHLSTQLAEAREKLREKQGLLSTLDQERSGILRQLQGHGALEDFLEMQSQLVQIEAEEASLRERFKAAEVLEGEATQLEIDRANLKRRLQSDYHERKQQLQESIVLLAEFIAALYDDRVGRFLIEATDNGPEFRIAIDGDRGGGISSMEIYCMDMTLFSLATRYLRGPGFLIHDSHLFDGVDERQVAQALLRGQELCKDSERQYIVTMNSDIFDRLPLPGDFDRSSVVLPVRLSDETETGGLFGFRFG